MPRVRILAGLAGDSLVPGEERDLPSNEAQQLIAEGRAELVRSVAIETPEGVRSMERTNPRRKSSR